MLTIQFILDMVLWVISEKKLYFMENDLNLEKYYECFIKILNVYNKISIFNSFNNFFLKNNSNYLWIYEKFWEFIWINNYCWIIIEKDYNKIEK